MSVMGRLAYMMYFAPRASMRRLWAHGPLVIAAARRGEAEMIKAATTLPPLPAPDHGATPLSVTWLTGSRFWHQTLFCVYTLARHSKRRINIRLVDDGSLTEEQVSHFRQHFSQLTVDWRADVEARLDTVLPSAKFPALRAHRLVYPHLRKLTDVHAGQRGWQLVLDSDMLFHASPKDLLIWCDAPDEPIHLEEAQSHYGYTNEQLEPLVGGKIRQHVNVGVIGLQSESIEWDLLERWTTTLLENHGSHYLLEQALTALLLFNKPTKPLPATGYQCPPTPTELLHPKAALHHYVAESKYPYFRMMWRLAVEGRT